MGLVRRHKSFLDPAETYDVVVYFLTLCREIHYKKNRESPN